MALHRNLRRLLSSPRASSGTAVRVLLLLLVASALTLTFGRNHGLLQFRRRAPRRHHLLLSTPDDKSEPFRLVTIDNGNITDVKFVPLEHRREEQAWLFNTHIVRHPDPHRSDEYFVAQEVDDGQILRLKLVDDHDEIIDRPHRPRLEVVQAEFTKGASPAYALVTRDRKALLCAHVSRTVVCLVDALTNLSSVHVAPGVRPAGGTAQTTVHAGTPHTSPCRIAPTPGCPTPAPRQPILRPRSGGQQGARDRPGRGRAGVPRIGRRRSVLRGTSSCRLRFQVW
jgi:hypothetical protein